MSQSYKRQHALKYCFFLIALFLTINIVACNLGEAQNSSDQHLEPSFQLFIFPNVGAKQLLHNVSQVEYQEWLDNVDLTNTAFSIDNSSISSFALHDNRAPSNRLFLTLNTGVARSIIQFLDPDSDADATLKGEYSLACMDEKAFLVMIRGKRAVGGTLRCPTARMYTHPQIFATSGHGNVLLDVGASSSEIRQIVSSLGSSIHGKIESLNICYCPGPQMLSWPNEQTGNWLPECYARTSC